MFYSIDEIYDLLMWDHQLSEEENEIKAQKGIDAAKHIRNLFPFIQPVIVPAGKVNQFGNHVPRSLLCEATKNSNRSCLYF